MKTLAMIHCLYYGYTVFFSDVDIAFLKDPLPYFDYSYDFNIQMEVYYPYYEVNSGFMYAVFVVNKDIDWFNQLSILWIVFSPLGIFTLFAM